MFVLRCSMYSLQTWLCLSGHSNSPTLQLSPLTSWCFPVMLLSCVGLEATSAAAALQLCCQLLRSGPQCLTFCPRRRGLDICEGRPLNLQVTQTQQIAPAALSRTYQTWSEWLAAPAGSREPRSLQEHVSGFNMLVLLFVYRAASSLIEGKPSFITH